MSSFGKNAYDWSEIPSLGIQSPSENDNGT